LKAAATVAHPAETPEQSEVASASEGETAPVDEAVATPAKLTETAPERAAAPALFLSAPD
jgi:hypothetical protein